MIFSPNWCGKAYQGDLGTPAMALNCCEFHRPGSAAMRRCRRPSSVPDGAECFWTVKHTIKIPHSCGPSQLPALQHHGKPTVD